MPAALVVRLIFWLWVGVAVLVGQQLLLARSSLAVPATLAGLTLVLLTAYFRLAAVRTWVDALDLRIIVLLHATRLVGIYFLVLFRRGQLPYEFAVPGGIGDIIVALLAVGIVFTPLGETSRLRAIRIWNIVGLVDISLVVLTAARLNLADATQMRALTYLPLSLLPTFLVPLIIATHIVIFVRLAGNRNVA